MAEVLFIYADVSAFSHIWGIKMNSKQGGVAMKTVYKFIDTENDHLITKASDTDFFLLIQRAALLGLKDSGFLMEMEYRQAEESLLRQYREDIRANFTRADGND